jgi:cephalosporin hydroxylase
MIEHEFEAINKSNIQRMSADKEFREVTDRWFNLSADFQYSYHFRWLGLPIIQYPQDTVSLQELIWETKPDLIIETGIARGGSLILSASLLAILDSCLPTENSIPRKRKVIGVEIDLRPDNREALMQHPLSRYIEIVDGSSTDKEVVSKIKSLVKEAQSKNVLIILDSNHSHEHVLKELRLYQEFVEEGGYLVVMDTVVENMDARHHNPSRWSKGDNPMTAVRQFLGENTDFIVDSRYEDKALISVAPSGYLKRVSVSQR